MQKIKLEELQMFVGTDLQDKYTGTLKGLDYNGKSKHYFPMYLHEGCSVTDSYDFNEIKPLVRPLNKFTDEQWLEVFKAAYPDWENLKDLNPTIYRKGGGISLVNGNSLNCSHCKVAKLIIFRDNNFYMKCNHKVNLLKSYQQIAKYHGDLFDWLGRGLAEEIKTE